MAMEHPYPRAFLLHEKGRVADLPQGWRQTPLLPSGWTLSHDPELEIDLRYVDDGSTAVLVAGLCLYAGDEHRVLSPATRLAEAMRRSSTAFLDELDMLGGRFVVFTADADEVVVRQDAMLSLIHI